MTWDIGAYEYVVPTDKNIDVNDLIGITDTTALLIPTLGPINVADNIGLTDEAIVCLVNSLSVSDSIGVTDVATLHIPFLNISVYDSLDVSDSSPASLPTYNVNVYDSISVTDNSTTLLPLLVNVADTLSITEAILSYYPLYEINVYDAFTAIDVPVVKQSHALSVFDAVILADDTATLLLPYLIDVADNIDGTDAAAIEASLSVDVYDSISLLEGFTGYPPVLPVFAYDLVDVDDEPIVEPPYIVDPFPPDADAAEYWEDVNVRFIVPSSLIKRAGNQIRIELAYRREVWSFAQLYIGHPTEDLAHDPYDFDGNQVEILSGGVSGGTVDASGWLSDWTTFNVNADKDLIMAFFFLGEQATPVTGTSLGYDLYFKFTSNEASITDVTDYTQPVTHYLRRYIKAIETDTAIIPLELQASDSIVVTEDIATEFVWRMIDVSDSIGVSDAVAAEQPYYLISVADNVAVNDTNSSVLQAYEISAYSSVDVTDAVTAVHVPAGPTLEASVNDALVLTDIGSVLFTDYEISVYDSLTVTDASPVELSPYEISVYDSVSITDATTVLIYLSWQYATSYDVTTGTTDSGDVTSTYVEDGTALVINEVSGAPGFLLDFTFGETDPVPTTKLTAIMVVEYNGNPAHNVKIAQYNYTAATWDYITIDTRDFPSGVVFVEYTFGLYNTSNYISSGEIQLRFDHISSGTSSHDFLVDFLRLLPDGSVNVLDTVNITDAVTVSLGALEINVYDRVIILADFGPVELTTLEINVSDNISVTDLGAADSYTVQLIAGTIDVTTTVAGSLSFELVTLAGTIDITSTLTASLTDSVLLKGRIDIQTPVTGSLSVTHTLIGTIDVVTVVTGTLSSTDKLATDTIAITCTVTGSLAGIIYLAGTIDITSRHQGVITTFTGITGPIAGQTTVTGSLSTSRKLISSVDIATTVVGTLFAGFPIYMISGVELKPKLIHHTRVNERLLRAPEYVVYRD